MTGTSPKANGFTIVELMIAVAILSVLAGVAIMAYSQYIKRARSSEAMNMLADVRLKQEAYRSTFHTYAFHGHALTWFPDGNPHDQKRAWDGDDAVLADWNQLGVRPDGLVWYSYTCVAGPPGNTDNLGALNDIPGIADIAAHDFWFAARAVQDFDADGACAGFEVHPGRQTITKFDEEKGTWCPQN